MITKDTTVQELQDLIDEGDFPIMITNAKLEDEYCHYGYDILNGPGAGDTIPKRKGSNIIHSDMQEAFKRLTPHIAILDDAFVSLKNKPKSLDEVVGHAITPNFSVYGFKVTGKDEDLSVILKGEKTVHHGEISLETPKINSSSKYAYWDELKEAVELCQMEVILYMHGKANPAYEQQSLEFPQEDKGDFENAEQ